MQTQFRFWRGYVTLTVKGKSLTQLINLAAEKKLQLWDIRKQSEEVAELKMLVRDFFRLRPLLRQTGCRIHVKHRFGFPFFLDKLGARKFFAAGVLLFIIGLFLLSSIVWTVQVQGNEKVQTHEILDVAKKQGIYPMQWKFRLKDADTLSRELQKSLPQAAWIGIELHGTKVTIKVVEATKPDIRELLSPRHLVAAKDATITSIIAEKGRPMVKVNAFVRKGDILISGLVGNEENHQIVVAKGTVKGIVWYTSKIEVPLSRVFQSYTGESFRRFFLVFGHRALQVTGYGKKNYEYFALDTEQKSLHLGNYRLPVGWMREKVMEVKTETMELTQQEAKTVGLDHARKSIVSEAGGEAHITAEKILHEKTENGKVYMEAHFEVEESIALEQPILQGE